MTESAPDTSQSLPSPTDSSHRIAQEIDGLVASVDSLENALPLIVTALHSALQKDQGQLEKYEQNHGESVDNKDGSRTVTFTSDTFPTFRRLVRKFHKAGRAAQLIPEVFIVALVSQYDAFLGGLVRALLHGRIEVLHATDRQVRLGWILAFDSISAVREATLNTEVEDLLRKSHPDQFSSLESKFNVELRKGLQEWPTFVELTERRNLYVHARGVVSRQYLDMCRKHGVSIPSTIDLGTTLYVDKDYFARAHGCILSVGIMLAHVLWRKLLPDQREHADRHLNHVCYELLVERRYELAQRLLTFAAATIKTFAGENYRRIMIVNLAQTYKWLDQNAKCTEIMNGEDWSASGDSFRLAHAVLRDDIDDAVRIMRRIGSTHDQVDKAAYREWPLFREIRREEQFRTTYQDIFGEPLEQVELKSD